MPTFGAESVPTTVRGFQQLAEQGVRLREAAEDLIASGTRAYNVSIVDDAPRREMA